MSQTSRWPWSGCWVHIVTLAALSAAAPASLAQPNDGTEVGVSDDVPTGARRAAEWKPSPEGLSGPPWLVSASAGFLVLGGDDPVDEEGGFAFELRASRSLTGGFYFAGSYLLGVVETDVVDPDDGSEEDETHFLHVPTLGVGWRAELSPEISLFIEPKIGALITSDDIGVVGGGTVGFGFQVDPGWGVRIGLTALAANASLDTEAGDADISGLFSVGIGLVFEF